MTSLDVGSKTQPTVRGFHKALSQIRVSCASAAIAKQRVAFSRNSLGSPGMLRLRRNPPRLELIPKL